jgi:hypothetical protein
LPEERPQRQAMKEGRKKGMPRVADSSKLLEGISVWMNRRTSSAH